MLKLQGGTSPAIDWYNQKTMQEKRELNQSISKKYGVLINATTNMTIIVNDDNSFNSIKESSYSFQTMLEKAPKFLKYVIQAYNDIAPLQQFRTDNLTGFAIGLVGLLNYKSTYFIINLIDQAIVEEFVNDDLTVDSSRYSSTNIYFVIKTDYETLSQVPELKEDRNIKGINTDLTKFIFYESVEERIVLDKITQNIIDNATYHEFRQSIIDHDIVLIKHLHSTINHADNIKLAQANSELTDALYDLVLCNKEIREHTIAPANVPNILDVQKLIIYKALKIQVMKLIISLERPQLFDLIKASVVNKDTGNLPSGITEQDITDEVDNIFNNAPFK